MGVKKRMQQKQQPQPSCSARGASFFKVMLGNFKRSLRVPPSFTRHIVGKAQCKFTMQSCIAGRSWHVEVERVDDNLFIHNGWGEFLKDHMINMGDFLVFNYDGNLGFTVHVYGSDGCKKEVFANDSKGKLAAKGAKYIVGYPGVQLNTKSNKELVVPGESEPVHRWRIRPTIVRSDRALEEALSFKPENPYFVAAWRQSRAYYMTVPMMLARKFDFGRKGLTTFHDYLGRLWPIEVRIRGDGRVNFTNGWSKFSRGNHLSEGDACVFEFIQEGEIIQAHIFQLEKETDKVIKRCAAPLHQDKRSSTTVGCEKALEEAISIKPENPCFVATWRWSRASYMTIPRSFATDNNLRRNKSILLHDPSGRTWPVRVSCRKDGRVDLGTGMRPFFRGNNVRDGDACVFQFSLGGVVKVHIERCPRT